MLNRLLKKSEEEELEEAESVKWPTVDFEHDMASTIATRRKKKQKKGYK